MGAPKTKTVGGGKATPVANDWFGFLSNTLKGGNAPGAGSMENMYGQMMPNQNAGMPQGGISNTMGSGMGGFQPQTLYTPAASQQQIGIGGNNRPLDFGAQRPLTGMQQQLFGGPQIPGGGSRSDYGNGMNFQQWEAQAGSGSNPTPMVNIQDAGAGGLASGIPFGGQIPGGGSQQGIQGVSAGGSALTGNGNGFMDRIKSAVTDSIKQQNQLPNIPGASGFASGMSNLMQPNIMQMIAQNPMLAGAMGYVPQGVNYNNATAGINDVNSFMSQFGGNPAALMQLGGVSPGGGGGTGGMGGLSLPELDQATGSFGFNPVGVQFNDQLPGFKAIGDIADRDLMKKTAEMRERYGLMGNTMSSGASLAEAQLMAEALPQKILALQEAGTKINSLGQNAAAINNQMQLGLLNAQIQDRLGRLGLKTDLMKTGANFGLNSQGNILNFLSDIQGQNLGAATSLAGQNAGNLTNTNIANSQGNFNASAANAGNMLDFNKFLGGMGLDLQQLAQSGQMGMIGQLINAYQQAAGIGTPQAQIVQQPSGLSQALNFGLNAAGTIGGLMTGNPAMALGGASGLMGGGGGGGYFSGPAPSIFSGQTLGIGR